MNFKLGTNPGENMCDAIGADCFDTILKNATTVSLCKDCPEDCDTVKSGKTKQIISFWGHSKLRFFKEGTSGHLGS